ncbi:MAG: DUF5110 domain-containing protein, partial [Acidimicrobiales bacterium]|nr:DUF5110 domain-containing protein [Acidimicrobiales bacterium]
FTASATDIGYGWWSHDIGGHLWGVRDDDLTVRWMQYGVFSPINRLHSSNNPFLIKEPWLFPLEARSAIAESLRLRNRLIPYLHSMNHRAARQGLPLVSPMYHLHPEDDRAYTHRNQYGFGDQLLVAPITKPLSRSTLMGAVETWLPPGQWVDIFTDAVYEGDTIVEMHRRWSSIPVLAQPGAIVPLTTDPMAAAAANPDAIELLVVPGRSGSFDLFEDDGSGSTPDDIWAATACTHIEWRQADSRSASLVIDPASGNTDALPPSRTWTITIIGGPSVESATTDDGRSVEIASAPGRCSIELDAHDARAGIEVRFEGELVAATTTVDDRCLDILNSAQIEYEAKLAAWRVIETQSSPAVRIAALAGLDIDADVFSALTEILACST